MTSDAKVGLLLGLVFVVIIAFLINGLPDLLGSNEAEQPVSTAISNSHTTTLVIGEQARQAGQQVLGPDPTEELAPRQVSIAEASEIDPRFSDNPPSASNPGGSISRRIPTGTPTTTSQTGSSAGGYYVVRPGDNLAEIAKKFYGPEKGNKHENVKRIYEANKQTLPSPDKIKSGQKLLIPALSVTQRAPKNVKDAQKMGLFEKIASIPDAWKKAGRNESRPEPPRQNRVYVVQPKDTLWNIAAKYLGSGHKYRQIVELNKDKLSDPGDIEEGMRLTLPPK
ncbi:LysM domain/BON superfamily protein [Anaerohalosphaera lusitana]|uniref:LysM domain/BON superfamily protein n=1 Tax=Anaerohalosphaera lusitana TaxID=1936003 RepID=A0A1U9NQD3_9BACT|nr:LysM peptidoglycan-binding domain-containing protein [Anaerohalosphaera lusitana]AQT70119.1 LysM domain/BON superfamily protein [Anaerohalosphaera lusitana]